MSDMDLLFTEAPWETYSLLWYTECTARLYLCVLRHVLLYKRAGTSLALPPPPPPSSSSSPPFPNSDPSTFPQRAQDMEQSFMLQINVIFNPVLLPLHPELVNTTCVYILLFSHQSLLIKFSLSICLSLSVRAQLLCDRTEHESRDELDRARQCYRMTASHSQTVQHDTASIALPDIKRPVLCSGVTHSAQRIESCHFIRCEVSLTENSSVMFAQE